MAALNLALMKHRSFVMTVGIPVCNYLSRLYSRSTTGYSNGNSLPPKWRIFSEEDKAVALNKLQNEVIGGTPFHQLSKNAQKKLLKSCLKSLAVKQKNKGREHLHQDGGSSISPSRKDTTEKTDARLQEKMRNGVKVAIDCSMSDLMSPKEISRLGRQVRLLYFDNRRAEKPFHLHLTGLTHKSKIDKEIQLRLQKLQPCYMEIYEQPHHEVFKHKDIVYLTPDSTQVLEDVECDKVYVLGGLVDSNHMGGYTHTKANELNLRTARLPIDRYMEILGDRGNYNCHCGLAINQVLVMLSEVHSGSDWRTVLGKYMPRRKGYALKNNL